MNLQEYLKDTGVDESLQTLMLALSSAVVEIAKAISGGNTSYAGSSNAMGEKQLALDLQANHIIEEILKNSGLVAAYSSEELEMLHQCEGNGRYAVTFDPLDGSSLVDVNFAVGTIFGVYEGNDFIGKIGDEQVASMIAVYGPRTTLVLTVRQGTCEFLFDGEKFVLAKHKLQVKEEATTFAPGNLRAAKFEKKYLNLVNDWCEKQYTLRYSGGMVPDVNHIFIKEQGVFTYPGYVEAPEGKLRLLYECAPMALLMEQAGGKASDGHVRILEKKIEKLHQRTPIFIGSAKEVERVEKFLFS